MTTGTVEEGGREDVKDGEYAEKRSIGGMIGFEGRVEGIRRTEGI